MAYIPTVYEFLLLNTAASYERVMQNARTVTAYLALLIDHRITSFDVTDTFVQHAFRLLYSSYLSLFRIGYFGSSRHLDPLL